MGTLKNLWFSKKIYQIKKWSRVDLSWIIVAAFLIESGLAVKVEKNSQLSWLIKSSLSGKIQKKNLINSEIFSKKSIVPLMSVLSMILNFSLKYFLRQFSFLSAIEMLKIKIYIFYESILKKSRRFDNEQFIK